MHNFLAIDAGGTSTRAVFLDDSGQCLGYGTAGGGNPASRGIEPALDALIAASEKALGGGVQTITTALVAMAGASLELPTHLFLDRFVTLGLTGQVVIESDLLAAFYSGSYQDNGSALIAGTGAVGARITASHLAAVADGTGWLLGDEGSGFWLGRQVARAVAAALDGRGRPTALTELVLADLGITLDSTQRTQGRLRAQQQLISKVYEGSAIELSRFAPLAFGVAEDPVAADIIDRAAEALARTLMAVAPGADEPLVFGGSVLTKGGTVAAAVAARLAAATPPVLVHDGVVGAAVLVLKRHGVEVGAEVFARIQGSLATLRG
ncbi:N-acetylglucosamine kinase [Arthrobacter sp. TMN-49]